MGQEFLGSSSRNLVAAADVLTSRHQVPPSISRPRALGAASRAEQGVYGLGAHWSPGLGRWLLGQGEWDAWVASFQ